MKRYDSHEIEAELKSYLEGLTGVNGIVFDTPLISSGIIDSMDIIHVLLFIEGKFLIKIMPFEIYIEDFQTIRSMAKKIYNQLEK